MTIKTKRFDIVEYLDSEEVIQEYLRQVFADGGAEEIVRAPGHVVRARGMAQVAEDAGLNRESLYKAFSGEAKPRFDTILRVSRAQGEPLTV